MQGYIIGTLGKPMNEKGWKIWGSKQFENYHLDQQLHW